MNLYNTLEEAICTDSTEIKEKLARQCFEYCSQNEFIVSQEFTPKIFKEPSYAKRCQIVEPKFLVTRKDLHTKEGLGSLIHSIVHIEYSAIDLALDAVYRYPNMSQKFKVDWLEVALDELQHYKMLEELLQEVGFSYGDFSVHSGLFDVSMKTAESLLDRMAVIPRYYEASGLDVAPQILKKLHNKRKVPIVKKLMDILDIIYVEEIVHVQKGDYWFREVCKMEGEEVDVYFKILERYYLLDNHRPHVNVKARQEAGFSCSELKRLAKVECTE